MDMYSSSAAARRYASQGSTAVSSAPSSSGKLKTGQLSNLSNLSNNSITKVFGAAKPRASSASITRRNNSKFDNPSSSLGGCGSFTVQQQQQQIQQPRGSGAFNLDVESASRPSNSSPVNGNSYSATNNNSNNSNSGGAFAGDAGRMDSYDQIRRNYEQSKLLGAGINGGIANSNALVSSNGAFSAQRAQSASGMRPPPQSSLAASSSNAYLAMRQQQQQQQASAGGYSLPYPDGTAGNNPSASVGLSLLRGSNSTANSNLLNINNTSISGNAGNNSAAVLTSKFGGTRGIANANASFNYGNTTAASLLNMSMNDFANGAFVPARVSSTELIPANYMPQPILCLKSNVTNQPKGVNKTDATAKQGKRVCFSTPLTTSTPLLNPFMFQNLPAPSAAQATTQQGMQALQSALNSSAAIANNGPVLGGGAGGGRFPVSAANLPAGAQGPQLGGLNRPTSASAALMTTATTHFLNNVNNSAGTGAGASSIAGGASNIVHNAGGIVLTGAAAVVTSSNNSRGNSPITVINPPQTNTFFNNSTTTSGANNGNTAVNTNSAGIASNNNTTNQSKPPLFLSTLGSQNYEGGVGSIVKPKPTLNLSKTDLTALYNVSETSTPVHNSTSVSPRGGTNDFPDAAMFPSIRSHTPSPVPTPSAHSTSYVPLFSQSASPGKPLPKGMVLSNSMDNFASYGVSKDDHASHSKSMPSVSGADAGSGAGAQAGNKTNYNTSFASAAAPGSSSDNSNTNISTTQSGSQLRRKDSADSLISELSLTRAAPPSSGAPKVPSPKTAAAAASAASAAANSLAREDYDFSTDISGGSSKSKKKTQRPSLAEQLAHIHINAQGGAAKTTDEIETPKTSTTTPSSTSSRGNGQESFFSQSLNSAIAIGRSVVSNIGAARLSTGSPTADLLDIEDRSTQSSGSAANNANASGSMANALFSVPARLFSVGSCNCKSPGRVMFYSDRCEYPFHHPHDSSVVNMVIQYSDMSGVTTVGTKLRFKIPRRSAQGLGEIDVLNSLHLVTLELTSTASMTNVREKIAPLITQSK